MKQAYGQHITDEKHAKQFLAATFKLRLPKVDDRFASWAYRERGGLLEVGVTDGKIGAIVKTETQASPLTPGKWRTPMRVDMDRLHRSLDKGPINFAEQLDALPASAEDLKFPVLDKVIDMLSKEPDSHHGGFNLTLLAALAPLAAMHHPKGKTDMRLVMDKHGAPGCVLSVGEYVTAVVIGMRA